MRYVCDFETTTDLSECRVWATGICAIDDEYEFWYGNNIEFFFNFAQNNGGTYYFHNLKFDGEYLFNWLYDNGYEYLEMSNNMYEKTFSSLISDKGQFYMVVICFPNGEKVKILDSLKLLNFSVDVIAKTFKLKMSKLKIDYKQYRAIDHKLTEEEIAYLHADVKIVAQALRYFLDQGYKKQITSGAISLYDYKKTIGYKKFKYWFPICNNDGEIRQCYKGGFTYLNPEYKEIPVEKGIVLDVNSLYPSVMYNEYLPYDKPVFYEGKYKYDSDYPLYIQMISCQFELKDNHVPSIQIKGTSMFKNTEYLTSSGNEIVTLCLTSVDLKLLFEQYNVYNVTWHRGYKYKQAKNMFKTFIDKWTDVKIKAAKEGNAGMRTIAKLMLNSLYGKFATNPNVRSKHPYKNDAEAISYRLGDMEKRDEVYLPVGAFITAYARYKTISSAQKVYHRFIYADTDSLHLKGTDIPECLEIDEYKLGAWKLEGQFERAKFIRQKTYMEIFGCSEDTYKNGLNSQFSNLYFTKNDNYYYIQITCAGMPNACYKQVTWDNFKSESKFDGKLRPIHTKGGIVLIDVKFTLKV